VDCAISNSPQPAGLDLDERSRVAGSLRRDRALQGRESGGQIRATQAEETPSVHMPLSVHRILFAPAAGVMTLSGRPAQELLIKR
jgi:hypothetical protein